MAPARTLFLVTQSFTFILGVIGVALAYISLYTDLNDFADFVPTEFVQGTGILSAAVVMVSGLGIFMVICKVDEFFALFVVISTLQLMFNIGFFVVVIFFKRGQETLPLLDNLLNDTIVNFEANALEIALEDPEGFIIVQDLLDCCGIDMETRFNFNDTFEEIFSGERCVDAVVLSDGTPTNGNTEMLNIMSIPGITIEEAIEAAEDNELLGQNFFCDNELENLAERSLTAMNAMLGVVIVFEVVSLVCSILIFACVKRDKKGKLDFDNADQMNRVIVKVTRSAKEPFVAGYARFNSFSDRSLGKRGNSLSLGNLSMDDPIVPENKAKLEKQARSSYMSGEQSGKKKGGVLGLIAPFATSVKVEREEVKNTITDKDSEIDTIPNEEEDDIDQYF